MPTGRRHLRPCPWPSLSQAVAAGAEGGQETCTEVYARAAAASCWPPTPSAHVGWAAATESRDGINKVFLHLGAESHTAQELLQEPAILHLGMCARGVYSGPLPHHNWCVGHAADDFGGWLECHQLLEEKLAMYPSQPPAQQSGLGRSTNEPSPNQAFPEFSQWARPTHPFHCGQPAQMLRGAGS